MDVLERAEQEPVLARAPGAEDLGGVDRFDRQARVSLERAKRSIERRLDRLRKRPEIHEARRCDRAAGHATRHRERVVGQGARVARHRPCLDLQQESRVGDRLRQRSERREVDPVRDRVAADDPVRRLQPHEPAAGGRDADRPSAVRRGRDRGHPGRHRCGRAPGRAAGRGLDVPRVPRRAVQKVVGESGEGELGLVRLADHDRAGGLETPGDQPVGGGRRRVREHQRAVRAGHALDVFHVLDEKRDPGEWPDVLTGGDPPVERTSFLQSLLTDGDHRVDRRVEPLDPLERHPHELLCGRPSFSHGA